MILAILAGVAAALRDTPNVHEDWLVQLQLHVSIWIHVILSACILDPRGISLHGLFQIAVEFTAVRAPVQSSVHDLGLFSNCLLYSGYPTVHPDDPSALS